MDARARKAVGCFVLLAYLALYAGAAATLGAALFTHAPRWAALFYYAVAGIIWVFPLRPLFAWMNRGA